MVTAISSVKKKCRHILLRLKRLRNIATKKKSFVGLAPFWILSEMCHFSSSLSISGYCYRRVLAVIYGCCVVEELLSV